MDIKSIRSQSLTSCKPQQKVKDESNSLEDKAILMGNKSNTGMEQISQLKRVAETAIKEATAKDITTEARKAVLKKVLQAQAEAGIDTCGINFDLIENVPAFTDDQYSGLTTVILNLWEGSGLDPNYAISMVLGNTGFNASQNDALKTLAAYSNKKNDRNDEAILDKIIKKTDITWGQLSVLKKLLINASLKNNNGVSLEAAIDKLFASPFVNHRTEYPQLFEVILNGQKKDTFDSNRAFEAICKTETLNTRKQAICSAIYTKSEEIGTASTQIFTELLEGKLTEIQAKAKLPPYVRDLMSDMSVNS